ncbi:MAG: hypothetical protein U1E05_04380 [Patescibacteria group bacterium]|nr:hypothetical protein [Patescibacteria group bacterium]
MLSDTPPEIEQLQIELLRQKTVTERMALAGNLTHFVIQLSRQAIARQHPEWTQRQVDLEWVAVHYGRELAESLRADLESR